MSYNKAIHNRQSIRLQGFDYSQSGVYFVTINVKDKNSSPCLMGKIINDIVILNDIGKIVSEVWAEIPAHFEGVELDTYIIMPDHIHGVIIINELDQSSEKIKKQYFENRGVVSRESALKRSSLGSIVGSFKAEVSRRINRKNETDGASFWQRNYYEHIIRSEKELEAVRNYIDNNPANWKKNE